MRYNRIHVLSVLAAMLLAAGSFAKSLSPRWDDMHTKHSWHAVPENWDSLGRPPAGTVIDLHIVLKPHHENALINALYEVSDPRNPKYGAHLSREQVADLVDPHPITLQFVHSWLEHYGVPSSSVSRTHGGNTLTLAGVPVSQANALLGASYQLYRHVETSETIIRTVGYALPATLHGHVQTVVPTTCFASPRMQWETPHKRSRGAAAVPERSASEESVTVLSNRDNNVGRPAFLRWLYGTFKYVPAATNQNVLAIAGYLDHYPSPTDLAAFMRKYRSKSADATFTVVQVNGGGYDPNRPKTEANLDIQYAEAMAYPTPSIFYSNGRGPTGKGDRTLLWLEYILALESIPQTISTSYGLPEKTYTKEYARHVCGLFAQLGARGVSVLFASGDHGVGRGSCRNKNGSIRFVTFFPATCPWVTVVGGTRSYGPEVAASLSGGGFSNYFSRPSYQERAAATFIQDLGSRYRGLYNASGRGIPDISAQALGFRIFLEGREKRVSGTSGSAPIVAGIISLLNDYRLSKGQASLGFLNPWLYDSGLAGLNDITTGSNPGCGTDGFSAVAGWDPVTGLGTLDFEQLLKVLPNV